MSVFVLDRRQKPLMPCSEKRARKLLAAGRARVHRLRPFTIRLRDRAVEDSALQPIALKLDPGSRGTGVALNRLDARDPAKQTVLHLAELGHRGARIRKALDTRRAFRRGRRSRNLRYRAARFANRRRPAGWLAPSLRHRLDTTLSWVARLRALAPVTAVVVERVRFDTQALENPAIEGAEYQRGTLAGYELREYILERDGRACAYCDAEGVPLNLDHVRPRARGGPDRPSNLVASCIPCNRRKGARPVEEFLAKKPERLKAVLARLKAPLKDAAAVNATRHAIWRALAATGLPVAATSGGRTKYNRHTLGIPKTHALDAAAAGEVSALRRWSVPTLEIACAGRGSRSRTRTDASGFPRLPLPRSATAFGFRTGDLVRAVVPKGKKAGTHTGRVAVRSTGSFNIRTATETVQGISHRHCRVLQRRDGYGYQIREKTIPQPAPNQEAPLPPAP
jgi:hypothetical protein